MNPKKYISSHREAVSPPLYAHPPHSTSFRWGSAHKEAVCRCILEFEAVKPPLFQNTAAKYSMVGTFGGIVLVNRSKLSACTIGYHR